MRDTSVSVKFRDDDAAPNEGNVCPLPDRCRRRSGSAAHPRWRIAEGAWSVVNAATAVALAPHANPKPNQQQVQSLRVFASGSVIQIGRWPVSMSKLYRHFAAYTVSVYPHIVDTDYARQRRLPELWSVAEEGDPEPSA